MNSFSKLRKKCRVIPDGLFMKCAGCGEIIYSKKLAQSLQVCPKCGYHYRIGARERIALLADQGSFIESNASLISNDPLEFNDGLPYPAKQAEAQAKSGENEAVITGEAQIEGHNAVLAAMDFAYIGGSVSSAVGEKIALAAEMALKRNIPFVLCTASGGVRMHEGILGLMQMAKTAAVLGRLREKGVPYIVILTNPTYGGATASFAMLGDITISEPGAMVGFAGQRVVKQTIHQDLPDGFQTAEFLLEHGQIDMIVQRSELKATLAKCLNYACSRA